MDEINFPLSFFKYVFSLYNKEEKNKFIQIYRETKKI